MNLTTYAQREKEKPLKVAVAGLAHGHVSWILRNDSSRNLELVGVYDKSAELGARLLKQFKLPESLFHSSLAKMLDDLKPEAVVAFGSIYEHLEIVKACAPRGIHVMVEKPLAVSIKHAEEMVALARKHKIHLLTNYETSWYPTTLKAYELVYDSSTTGKMRKLVFHHGHQGPKEIGVSKDFFDWLTDPVLNGGGALIDFGCYGANIMTWLMKGQKPLTVTAVTRQYKPEIYPKVDDEATIIVTYPEAQCIIQASWNWPYNRKDMEIYGSEGYIMADNFSDIRYRGPGMKSEVKRKVSVEETGVYTDPFKYLNDIIRNKIKVSEFGLYSAENNLMVVRILEAARESAKSGRTIRL